MRRIFRYLFIGTAAALLFLAALVAVFVAVFDANEYRDDLSALALEHSGRDLQFHGDISLTVFPALGMKLGAMSLSNAEGFGPKPMVKIGSASVSVDLGSLVRLQPEVEKLVLRDLEVDLQKNAAGVTNWDDLVPDDSDTGSAADTPASGGGEASKTSAASIEAAFGGLDLQDIRLSWRDAQAGTELLIYDLDLTTGRIVPEQAFPLTLHLDASASGDLNILVDLATMVEFRAEPQQLILSEMSLALNEYRLDGDFQLQNFAKPAFRFDLSSPDLDIDALLAGLPGPEPAATVEPADAPSAETTDMRIELPMETMRDLDIDGKLRIERLKAMNLNFSEVDISLGAKNGLVSLKPVTLKAYDGTVASSVVIDVRGDVPKYGISEDISGVRVGELLDDYSGDAAISGRLHAESNLTTRGEWLSELKRNSNGTLGLTFLEGALNGFNIRHSIDVAKARIRGEPPPAQEQLKTDFSSLSLSGVVTNGVFSSDDLELQAPLMRAGGRGSADFNTETVDFLLEAKLVGTLEGQSGQQSDELAGLAIPVAIEGPFEAPGIDVQLDEMLKAKADAAKEKIKADIERQKQELQQQIEAEKKALEQAKTREQEKIRELEKARLEKEKAEAEDKAREKLEKLFD